MKDFQKRLIIEHQELNDKIGKLYDFLQSKSFMNLSEEEQTLLDVQYNAMRTYGFVLAERLKIYLNSGEITIEDL